MSSLSAKDRVSLCSFTFSDGRRCRTPRTGKNPHFCFDHAQKEARANAEESLSKDLAYFFSGDYLSACDLSTALGRLIPAVLRGDVKPRTARTVAYLAQTLLQTIHISQQEYINAFGTNGWRQSIRDSVNYNHDYLFPPGPTPAPEPQPPAPSALRTNLRSESPQPNPPPAQAQPPAETPGNCHSERSEEPAFSSRSSLATHHSPLPQTPPPHTPLPPTSTEFVQQVLGGRNLSGPGRKIGSFPTTPHVRPAPPNPQPSSPSAPLTPTGATSPASPRPHAQPPASPPTCLDQGRRVNPREPNRDAPWLNWSPTSNIPPDSKLL